MGWQALNSIHKLHHRLLRHLLSTSESLELLVWIWHSIPAMDKWTDSFFQMCDFPFVNRDLVPEKKELQVHGSLIAVPSHQTCCVCNEAKKRSSRNLDAQASHLSSLTTQLASARPPPCSLASRSSPPKQQCMSRGASCGRPLWRGFSLKQREKGGGCYPVNAHIHALATC